MLEQLLARLNADGTIKKAASPETAGANKVVLTGYDGLIDSSLVPIGSPTLGSITAAKITYDHTSLPNTENLQELLDTFNGFPPGEQTPVPYFLKVEEALAEFDDTQQAMAFENIKQAGTEAASGVVFPAAYDQTLNKTTAEPHTPYAVGPKTANYRYLIKNNGNPDTPNNDVAVDAQTMQGLIKYTTALSTGLLNPLTAATTLVSKEYVDSAVSNTLNVRTRPIFWVSPVGSDIGGASQYCSLTYPYASIQKALSDATNWRSTAGMGTSPLTVVVMPGAYAVSDLAGAALAASYVNLHFMPGAKLTYGGNASAPLFNFNSDNPGFSVTGYGEFYLTNTSSSSSLVSCPANTTATANATINFECQSITIANSGKAIVLDYPSLNNAYYLTANISIKGDILNSSSSSAAIYLDRNNLLQLQINGNLTSLNAVGIYIGATGDDACANSIQNIVLKDMTCAHECFFIGKCGDLTITANKLQTTAAYATIKVDSSLSGDGVMLQANKILNTGSYCVHFSDGYLQIKDAKLKTSANTLPVIGVNGTSGKLTLKNLDLIAATGGATIAQIGVGTANVYLMGYIRTNSSTHTGINFQGGVFDYVIS